MDNQEDPNSQQFFDKRDEKYYKLHSPHYFFEIFNHKKHKSDVPIPETLIFSDTNAKFWYFNSKSKGTILRRGNDKLNLVYIAKYFSRIRDKDDKMENLILLKQVICELGYAKEKLLHMRYKNGGYKELSLEEMVTVFIDKQIASAKMVQQLCVHKHSSKEVYYCEIRHDVQQLPCTLKFFKKTSTTKFVNQLIDDPNDDKEDQYVKRLLVEKKFFKCFDQSLNQRMENITRKVMDFIELAYYLKARKLITKFIYDVKNQVYFIGIKELLIDFPAQCKYKVDNLILEFQNSEVTFEQFIQMQKND